MMGHSGIPAFRRMAYCVFRIWYLVSLASGVLSPFLLTTCSAWLEILAHRSSPHNTFSGQLQSVGENRKHKNMLGWINDCTEKLVIEKFGVDAWHIVKQKAGCDVQDGGFLKLDHYSDKSTIDLVTAASDVSGLSVDEVLEAFGAYFVPYIIREGYENLLCCQGSTFKDWMININAIHQHLQTTFPKKMIMPEFWCEDQEDGSIKLYYLSKRGNLLAPLAKGLVTEIAQYQFGLDIDMTRLTTQGVSGARFTR